MNHPWAVILCKFTDGDDAPFPKQYHRDLFTPEAGGSPWNMVRYFDDWSHGRVDAGWDIGATASGAVAQGITP